MKLIRHEIALGTKILKDMWKGYNVIHRILKSGKPIYTHFTVNHSKNFLNPTDKKIHTQNIERLWRSTKRRKYVKQRRKTNEGIKCKAEHRKYFKDYLNEF